MSKILSDTLRTKNNYKYAIHFSDTFSLNVLLWMVSILFEGGKALINPAQWIICCCITEVAYMITLYMGKWLHFFYKKRQKQYYLDSSNPYFGKGKQVEASLALYLRNLRLFSNLILLVTAPMSVRTFACLVDYQWAHTCSWSDSLTISSEIQIV